MAAFLAAASRCDPSLIRDHQFDVARAFDAVRRDAVAAASEERTSRSDRDDDLGVGKAAAAAAAAAPAATDAAAAASTTSATLLRRSRERMAFQRAAIQAAAAAADAEAAAAAASVRSRAHDVNAFHAVVGATLPTVRVPLTMQLHNDLVDRERPRSLHHTVTTPPLGEEQDDAPLLFGSDRRRGTLVGPSAPTATNLHSHTSHVGGKISVRGASSALVAPPPHAPSLVASLDAGVPRRASDRARYVDEVQRFYRARLLTECEELQREHPHMRQRRPEAVPTLRDDDDDGRYAPPF